MPFGRTVAPPLATSHAPPRLFYLLGLLKFITPGRCSLIPLMLWFLSFIYSFRCLWGRGTYCVLNIVWDAWDNEPDSISALQKHAVRAYERRGVEWLPWWRKGVRSTGTQPHKAWLGLAVANTSEVCFDLLRRGAFISKFSRRMELLPVPQQAHLLGGLGRRVLPCRRSSINGFCIPFLP